MSVGDDDKGELVAADLLQNNEATDVALDLSAFPFVAWAAVEHRTHLARAAFKGRLRDDVARNFVEARWWRVPPRSLSRSPYAALRRRLKKYAVCELFGARCALIRKLANEARLLERTGHGWTLTRQGVALQALLNDGFSDDAARRLDMPAGSSPPRFAAKLESSASYSLACAELIRALVATQGSPEMCIERLCVISGGPTPLLVDLVLAALHCGTTESRSAWLVAIANSGLLTQSHLVVLDNDDHGVGQLDATVELDVEHRDDASARSAAYERVECRIPFWKLTCAARHAAGRFVGSPTGILRGSGNPRWWNPKNNRTGESRARRFALWLWLIRSSKALSAHRGCEPAVRPSSVYVPPGYVEPLTRLTSDSLADFGEADLSTVMLRSGVVRTTIGDDAVFAALANVRAQLGDGGLCDILRNEQSRFALCRALGGLRAALLSRESETGGMWWAPPERALPLLSEAWHRALPWHRAILAFGEVPAAAWNAACNFDDGEKGTFPSSVDVAERILSTPERLCPLGVGVGQSLLLTLLAHNPGEAAHILAHVVRGAIEEKTSSAACSVSTLVVAALEGPTNWTQPRILGPRARFPSSLAIVLAAGDRDATDDEALEDVLKWAPNQAAAWCACALASTGAGGSIAIAANFEDRLHRVLCRGGRDACIKLFTSTFCALGRADQRSLLLTTAGDAPRSSILESAGLSVPLQAALVTELERLATVRASTVPGVAHARDTIGYALACGQQDGARPALVAIVAAAIRFASSASTKSNASWTVGQTRDDSYFTSTANAMGGIALEPSAATAWRTVGELFVATSVLLRHCDAEAVASVLPMLCWLLEMYTDAMFAARDRIDTIGAAAMAAARRSPSYRDGADVRIAARDAETNLLGVAAQSEYTSGSPMSVLHPQGQMLMSSLPAFSSFLVSCRLLARISGTRFTLADANDGPVIAEAVASSGIVSQARQAALTIVTETLFGAETACCAWLSDLGGSAEDLMRGNHNVLASAATRVEFAPALLGNARLALTTVTARAALGLSGAVWRSRRGSGHVSMAPVDDALSVASPFGTGTRKYEGNHEDCDVKRERAALATKACVVLIAKGSRWAHTPRQVCLPPAASRVTHGLHARC